MKVSWVTALAAAGALAATMAVAPPAGATPSAATLYQQALATTKGWSVHYVSSGTSATASNLETGDAGPASGTQEVTIHDGSVSDQASLIVIGEFTYVKGTASSLVDLMGLPSTVAAADADHWVTFSTANPDFAQIVAGVRSHDVAQELAIRGPFTLGPQKMVDGIEVDAIRGTQGGQGAKVTHAVLYVRATGRPTIVEEDTVGSAASANGQSRIVFSRWGERVRPMAPAAAITIGPVRTT